MRTTWRRSSFERRSRGVVLTGGPLAMIRKTFVLDVNAKQHLPGLLQLLALQGRTINPGRGGELAAQKRVRQEFVQENQTPLQAKQWVNALDETEQARMIRKMLEHAGG